MNNVLPLPGKNLLLSVNSRSHNYFDKSINSAISYHRKNQDEEEIDESQLVVDKRQIRDQDMSSLASKPKSILSWDRLLPLNKVKSNKVSRFYYENCKIWKCNIL